MRIRGIVSIAIVLIGTSAMSLAQEKTEASKWMPGSQTPNICVAKLNPSAQELTLSLLIPLQPGTIKTEAVQVPSVDANGKQVFDTETIQRTVKKLEMQRVELLVQNHEFQTLGGKKLGIEDVKQIFANPKHVVYGSVPHPYFAEVLKTDLVVITMKRNNPDAPVTPQR